MDCAECVGRVQRALESVPGVESARVLLAAEKAIVWLDAGRVDRGALEQAVARAGYAATIPSLGSLRVTASGVGAETTFGRVLRLVEEAEAHRGRVQRLADRFSGYYLPFVLGVAGLTYVLGRDPLATAAAAQSLPDLGILANSSRLLRS